MNRTSTFKMALWLLIFVGSALSVKSLRRTLHANHQLTTLTQQVSVAAVRVSQLTRTFLLP